MRLLREHLRRSWWTGTLVTLGAGLFTAVAMRAYTAIVLPAGTELMMSRLPKPLQAALGMDRLPFHTLNGFLAVILQHPFLLAALLALPVTLATGLLTREVERRTLPLLLVRRVGRVQIVLSAALVTAFWMLLASAAAWAGVVAGSRWAGVSPAPDPAMVARVAANLFLLGAAVGGASLALASLCNERGEAVQWCVVPLLIMYVWHFLAQFWPDARTVAENLLFHHYSPVRVVLEGAVPAESAAVLGTVAVAGVVVAAVVFHRREFSL